jgi:hypothetical protein
MLRKIMSDPNSINQKHISDYIEKYKDSDTAYMLTIARDGETPARSIYYMSNAIDAAEAYNRYQDWGFAKEYLTVKLYEPGGKISSKVLRRPKAGECVFVKADYIRAEEIILSVKEHLNPEIYAILVKDFAGLFSRDNIRFDVSRFFKSTQCEEVNE